jgi:hypothetical protein
MLGHEGSALCARPAIIGAPGEARILLSPAASKTLTFLNIGDARILGFLRSLPARKCKVLSGSFRRPKSGGDTGLSSRTVAGFAEFHPQVITRALASEHGLALKFSRLEGATKQPFYLAVPFSLPSSLYSVQVLGARRVLGIRRLKTL